MILSIVIPTYNRSEELHNLIVNINNSVPKKYRNEIEVIISDDSDNDVCILANKGLAENYIFKNIHYVLYYPNKYPRIGPAANRQNGLDNAKGDWVIFVDDDDTVENMEDLLDYLSNIETNENSFIVTQYTMFDKDKQIISFTDPDCFMKILTHGKIYNRKFLEEYGIKYDITAPAHEDVYFNYAVYCYTFALGNYNILYPSGLKYYRFFDNPDSLSHKFGFYDKYITDEPRWFLNKFDIPLDLARSSTQFERYKIFTFIKNDLFYAIHMYIMMNRWGSSTTENEILYMNFFKKCEGIFTDSEVYEKDVVDLIVYTINENKLIDKLEDITKFIMIIKSIFNFNNIPVE